MEKRYKFLWLRDGKICSEYDGTLWEIGVPRSLDGEIELCEYGYHCSVMPSDAFSYVYGNVLAEVAVSGTNDVVFDKEAWQTMTLVRAWHWTAKDSVAYAVYAARCVLPIFESVYPHDLRPRQAIEAAATTAARAAEAAAEAARAEAAARAARAAEAAARAATAARAAGAAFRQRLSEWMIERIEQLEPVVQP